MNSSKKENNNKEIREKITQEESTESPSSPTTSISQDQMGQSQSQASSQADLEKKLWQAADILRSIVDAADYKSYIFPILFYKFISDLYDDQYNVAINDFGNDEDAKEYGVFTFIIPDGCHWSDLKAVSDKRGAKIMNIFHKIEQANYDDKTGNNKLEDVFGDAAWDNTNRLPEANLAKLIDHFSTIDLSPNKVGYDTLGAAYEYLLKQFADASGKKAGEFFTPRSVVRVITRLANPEDNESIYDPACGSAGILLEAYKEVKEKMEDPRTLSLYGQEVNLTTSAIAKMNLLLHDIKDVNIERGDTLLSPKFFSNGDDGQPAGSLKQFDVVLANPPFSLSPWAHEEWAEDPYGRNTFGNPPKGNADFAWVQHMLKSIKSDTGRMAIVMAQGVLFRGGAEGKIRKEIIKSDYVEAVITLPSNLFYNTSIPACILVMRKTKKKERKGNIVFIDASTRFQKEKNLNVLNEDDINAIIKAYETADDPDGEGKGVSVAVATLEDINDKDYSLNTSAYIEVEEEERESVDELLVKFKDQRDKVNELSDKFIKIIEEGKK